MHEQLPFDYRAELLAKTVRVAIARFCPADMPIPRAPWVSRHSWGLLRLLQQCILLRRQRFAAVLYGLGAGCCCGSRSLRDTRSHQDHSWSRRAADPHARELSTRAAYLQALEARRAMRRYLAERLASRAAGVAEAAQTGNLKPLWRFISTIRRSSKAKPALAQLCKALGVAAASPEEVAACWHEGFAAKEFGGHVRPGGL